MEKETKNIIDVESEAHLIYPDMAKDFILSRLRQATGVFAENFGGKKPRLFSAPGRTELGGNHTDHQGGQVIAGAVALDNLAAALPNNENVIRIMSDKFAPLSVKLDNLTPVKEEQGTSASLVRGVAEYYSKHGRRIGGFDAYTSNLVPVGSGLSSSAAFEVLVAEIINGLYTDGNLSPREMAQASKYAENVHFGKPSGLMDQMSSATGGIIKIDFKTSSEPSVTSFSLNFSDFGYALCIIDIQSNHENLTGEYKSIPTEMTETAKILGGENLSEISPELFYAELSALKGKVSDRALLRAMHFFNENERVSLEAEALAHGDFESFLKHVRDSGRSSWMLLQNIYPSGAVKDQPAALALAWCEKLLGGSGACRIHGGGFGGTIQAFVPIKFSESFKDAMEELTGKGSCLYLPIRSAGSVEIVY